MNIVSQEILVDGTIAAQVSLPEVFGEGSINIATDGKYTFQGSIPCGQVVILVEDSKKILAGEDSPCTLEHKCSITDNCLLSDLLEELGIDRSNHFRQ